MHEIFPNLNSDIQLSQPTIFYFESQEGRKIGYGSMPGIPLIASSPVRHDSPLNLHGLEVTSYQPPWKALSDFALHSDLDHNGVINQTPAFQNLVNQVSWSLLVEPENLILTFSSCWGIIRCMACRPTCRARSFPWTTLSFIIRQTVRTHTRWPAMIWRVMRTTCKAHRRLHQTAATLFYSNFLRKILHFRSI